MLGSHLIRTCSKTQSVVAKSSGESELYGVVRASTEGLGMVTLLADFGVPDAKVSIGMDAKAAMGMAQRVGLQKVRHVEVDVLWIQEQQARRLLPLRKVPGPQNPSDLCTKNVPAALMEQHLAQLYVHHAEGRAAVAQQLHAVGPRSLVIASPGVGILLPGVVGGRTISAGGPDTNNGGAQQPRSEGELPTSVTDMGQIRATQKKQKSMSPEERCVDSWLSTGADGLWKRAHRTPRRTLFTPFRVAGGPEKGTTLKKIRVTRGKYLGSQQEFQIIDDYTVAANLHRMLKAG